jgi:hypothetical protein
MMNGAEDKQFSWYGVDEEKGEANLDGCDEGGAAEDRGWGGTKRRCVCGVELVYKKEEKREIVNHYGIAIRTRKGITWNTC